MPRKPSVTAASISFLALLVIAIPISVFLISKGYSLSFKGRAAVLPTVNARNYPTVQAALDAVKDTGGNVYLPTGDYLIDEKIRVFSNVTLYGDGIGKTTIHFNAGKSDHMMGNDSTHGLTNIMIRDLSLKGPGASTRTTNCCYGLKLENLTNGYVINVESTDFGFDGIYLGYKLKSGIAVGDTNVRVTGCVVSNNGRNGIALTQGQNNIIDNCTVTGNSVNELVAGIDLEPDEGNNVSNNKVVGNTVSGNRNNGINLYSADRSNNLISQNAICNNNASGNSGTSIADHNGTNNIYVGNDVVADGPTQSGPASACSLPTTIPQFMSEISTIQTSTSPTPTQSARETPTSTPSQGTTSRSPTPTFSSRNPSVTPTLEQTPGDIDHSGGIDRKDFDAILTNYGNTSPSNADLNDDGIIDLFDYSIEIRYMLLLAKQRVVLPSGTSQ